MGKIDKEKYDIDADILQCKANILRAKDIIPPFGPERQKSRPEPEDSISTVKPTQPPIKEQVNSTQLPQETPIKIHSIPEFEEIMPNPAKQDIPEFNLAEQIFAEQRKLSLSKRRRPEQQTAAEIREQIDEQELSKSTKPQEYSPLRGVTSPPASPQQRVIADIIAKDIEKMIIKS